MKVGVPKEVKNHEYRVAITPAGVHELVRDGHEVYVQQSAGDRLVHPRRGLRGGRGADPADRGRCLAGRRPDPEGQGAGGRGVPPDAQGPGAVHLPAPGRQPAVHGRAAGVRHHRDRVRDRAAAGRLAAAAGADVGGRGPDGAAGRRASPAARRRRPGCADGRRVRCLRSQGRGAGRGRVRHELGRDRARHAGRGAAGRQEHHPAALRPTPFTRVTARPLRPTRTRSSARSSMPTWSSARCSCPAPRRRP